MFASSFSAFVEYCRIRRLAVSVAALTACGAAYLASKYVARRRLRAKTAARRERDVEQIKKLLDELKSSDVKQHETILKLSPEEILQATKQGKWKPVDIVQAYMYKACLSTLKWNSVTFFMSNAQDEARALEEVENRDDLKLYGLPVSVKDHMETMGLDCALGLTTLMDQPADDDGVIVKVLRHCGAVPFVKTNLPQQLMSFTSCNPIHGETSNPARLGFAPGGSSSGEGSLLASGGSVLGLGTDMAGSIRVPAHLCGVAGLKPTLHRLSVAGLQGAIPGVIPIAAMIGPMAKDVKTLVLCMRALLCPLMFKLDRNVPPIPFNEEVFNSSKKLRIGYYVDDGYNEPIPAIKRGVLLAKGALEKAGHVLVPFKVPKIEEAMEIITAAVVPDGGEIFLKQLRGSLEEPRLASFTNALRCPSFLRKIKTFLLGLRWPRLAKDLHLHGGGDRSVTQLWNLLGRKMTYKKEFVLAWETSGLDAIICPPYPIASGPYKHFEKLSALMNYTVLFNLLDYPAGVVPVTTVSQADVDALRDFKGHYEDPWDANVKETCTDSVGMPVGVQCVAQPWQEELCLRVMRDVESNLAKK